jgi:hypothetical protein
MLCSYLVEIVRKVSHVKFCDLGSSKLNQNFQVKLLLKRAFCVQVSEITKTLLLVTKPPKHPIPVQVLAHPHYTGHPVASLDHFACSRPLSCVQHPIEQQISCVQLRAKQHHNELPLATY